MDDASVRDAAGPAGAWVVGPRVHVRPLADDDIGAHYAEWFADPVIRRFIRFGDAAAPTLAQLREYRDRMNANPGVDFLGIFVNDNGRHIGNIKFEVGSAPDEMHAGFLIGDSAWRRSGVLREVGPACFERVIRSRKLRRLFLTVSPANIAGVAAFTSLGFRSTGEVDGRGDLVMDYAPQTTGDRRRA